MYAYTYVCVYVCVCVCVRAVRMYCVCVCPHSLTHTCMHVHTMLSYTCIHACMHTYIHTYINTYCTCVYDLKLGRLYIFAFSYLHVHSLPQGHAHRTAKAQRPGARAKARSHFPSTYASSNGTRFWKHCFLLGLLGSYSRTLDALQGCSNDWCCKLSGHRRSDALQEWKVRNPEPESFDWGLSSY